MQIDVVGIYPFGPPDNGRVIRAEKDPRNFGLIFQEFLDRGDCVLILELDDMSELGIAPGAGGWRVATHKFGEPSIASQLRRQPHHQP